MHVPHVWPIGAPEPEPCTQEEPTTGLHVGLLWLAQVLTLSRDAFERLMGPAETILAEQVAQYERVNQGMSFSAGPNL